MPREEVGKGGDDERSTVAVLCVGGMHYGCEQHPGCVGDDLTLAALYFLGRIEAAGAAGLGRLFAGEMIWGKR